MTEGPASGCVKRLSAILPGRVPHRGPVLPTFSTVADSFSGLGCKRQTSASVCAAVAGTVREYESLVHKPHASLSWVALLTVCFALAKPDGVVSEQVAVRQTEGLIHGFLTLKTLDGSPLAHGDYIQVARGNRVKSRVVFRFNDGSSYDETTVFSQRQRLRLLSDHVTENGPAFPQPLDLSIDTSKGQVTVRYTDQHGNEKVDSEHLDLPADLANGLLLTVLKHVPPRAPPKTLSFVAATPNPRLVKLSITTAGEDLFSTGGAARPAIHYVLKVALGGIAGVVAPLVGKQPPDSHVWILGGEAPTFVKSEQPLYSGGPLWRIELASPAWPHANAKR